MSRGHVASKAGAALAVLALLLAGCSSVTQQNYNRVEKGMTYDQVVGILGDPADTKSVGIGDLSGTSATWESDELRISIQFVNQKVVLKSLTSKTKGSSG